MTGAARAQELMEAFARETGLTGDASPNRYLWTDAYAVCNYLGLRQATGEERYRELALGLVDQVHHVLGRHRADDDREGWISGLSEEEGARHPTAGGLRIGKEHPERGPDEPLRPREEWDRDGQYYHYLTKWMHALERVFRATGEPRYHRWAVELAVAAHRAFTHDRGADTGLYWKMSIDLSRPLVPTTGLHDPLDGLLTLASLQASAPEDGGGPALPAGHREGARAALEEAVDELDQMCAGRSFATDDPLGAGGLIGDAYRAVRLRAGDALPRPGLEVSVGEDAAASLEAVARSDLLDRPADRRLAFRELGLAIGLAAGERLLARFGGGDSSDPGAPRDDPLLPRPVADRLAPHLPLREEIQGFWSDPAHREAAGWREHPDISRVMLATYLEPGGFLG